MTMNSSDYDDDEDGSEMMTPAQMFTNDPVYNQALIKSRYLQWSNMDHFAEAIANARLSPQAEAYMFTLFSTLTDHMNSLTTLAPDDIMDLELAREVHFISAKQSFTTNDVNSPMFWSLKNSMFTLQDLTWKMARGGNERLLQNRTDQYQVVTQNQNQNLQMPGDKSEKRGFRFWRK